MTAQYVKADRSSHWYTRDGRPMHEVPRADGKGMRPTTITDALKLDLFTSVSGIISEKKNFMVERYKLNQMANAAVALRHRPVTDMTDEEYAEELIRLAESPGKEAADFGTTLHRAIEEWLNSGMEVWPEDENLIPFMEGFAEWWHDQGLRVLATEQSFCRPDLGYGGTCDMLSGGLLVDWKTQKGDTVGALTHYDEWGMQLAAYGKAMNEPKTATVAISSTTPGIISMHKYSKQEMEDCWETFRCLRDLFYSPKGRGRKLSYG